MLCLYFAHFPVLIYSFIYILLCTVANCPINGMSSTAKPSNSPRGQGVSDYPNQNLFSEKSTLQRSRLSITCSQMF